MSPSSTTGFLPNRLSLFSIPNTPPPGDKAKPDLQPRDIHLPASLFFLSCSHVTKGIVKITRPGDTHLEFRQRQWKCQRCRSDSWRLGQTVSWRRYTSRKLPRKRWAPGLAGQTEQSGDNSASSAAFVTTRRWSCSQLTYLCILWRCWAATSLWWQRFYRLGLKRRKQRLNWEAVLFLSKAKGHDVEKTYRKHPELASRRLNGSRCKKAI